MRNCDECDGEIIKEYEHGKFIFFCHECGLMMDKKNGVDLNFVDKMETHQAWLEYSKNKHHLPFFIQPGTKDPNLKRVMEYESKTKKGKPIPKDIRKIGKAMRNTIGSSNSLKSKHDAKKEFLNQIERATDFHGLDYMKTQHLATFMKRWNFQGRRLNKETQIDIYCKVLNKTIQHPCTLLEQEFRIYKRILNYLVLLPTTLPKTIPPHIYSRINLPKQVIDNMFGDLEGYDIRSTAPTLYGENREIHGYLDII